MRISLILFLIAIQPLTAILSPFYQGQAEIEAILDSDELQECLGTTRSVSFITKNEEGWIVGNGVYQVLVRVKYDYDGKLGPANFHLSFDCVRKVPQDGS